MRSVYFFDSETGWAVGSNSSISTTRILKTTNGGSNWSTHSIEGVGLNSVYFKDSNTGWVVGSYGSILKTTDGGATVNVNIVSTELPIQYSLLQNYPNPFNPRTIIKFDILKKSFVRVTIYNTLGEEITTLVNKELNVGSYQTDWNAGNNPSGVYFYKIETGYFRQTKKMVLLK